MLLILEILGKSDRPLTATEINTELGLPKQSIHRLCTTLEQEGFLTRHGDTHRFVAARRLRSLGLGLLSGSHMHIARRQILTTVARQVGETVNFAVPEGSGMSYQDRVETDWAFRIQLPIGSEVPFHCTASGKCYLAALPKRARRSLVSAIPMEQMTENTHSDPLALLDELDEIALQGYSLDREEFMEGMVAIAVPVHDPDGKYIASLACHGPTQRFPVERLKNYKTTLQSAAAQLSAAYFEHA
ncbi:MAG: IclR family transcriptional regulator [Pseudomonadota bacterium]